MLSCDGSERRRKSELAVIFINFTPAHTHTLSPHWSQWPLLRPSRAPDIIRLLHDARDAVTSLPKRKFQPLLRQHYVASSKWIKHQGDRLRPRVADLPLLLKVSHL